MCLPLFENLNGSNLWLIGRTGVREMVTIVSKTWVCVFSLILLASTFQFAFAQDAPTGRVILEVSGDIARTNGEGVMRYDLAMLESLGAHEILTETPWTHGMHSFVGVLARDIMKDVDAQGTKITATALNDYSVDIPIIDFQQFGVIFAFQKDSKYLTVRGRGPLWVIYPWSSESSLQNELYYSRSIWQLQSIDVRSN